MRYLHIIRSSETRRMDDRVPDITLYMSAIRHDESLAPLDSDIERFKYLPRYPRMLAAGVDYRLGELVDRPSLREVLDTDGRAQRAHRCHDTVPR